MIREGIGVELVDLMFLDELQILQVETTMRNGSGGGSNHLDCAFY